MWILRGPTDDPQVNNRINEGHSDYNKAFHDKYKELHADPNAVYSFNRIKPQRNGDATKYGFVSSSGRNEQGQDLININYTFAATGTSSKEAFLLEETFHAGQYMNGDFGFQSNDNGGWDGFALDKHDEAEAQHWSAQNVKGSKSEMERALLKAYDKGGINGVVNFLDTRPGKSGYGGLSRDKISAEDMFRKKNSSYGQPIFNSNGTSAIPSLIMRRKP